MKLALYFGYVFDSGHFLRKGSSEATLEPGKWGVPWSMSFMDGGLLNNGKVPDQPDGRVFWAFGGFDDSKDNWFAFYWWDRSGDSRAASNSGFYVLGFGVGVNRDNINGRSREAFEFACSQWPDVVKRQHYPLVLKNRGLERLLETIALPKGTRHEFTSGCFGEDCCMVGIGGDYCKRGPEDEIHHLPNNEESP